MPEPFESLNATEIRGHLRNDLGLVGAGKFDFRIVAETGSTNDDVLKFGGSGCAEGTVLFADNQTAGRGRRGDAWVSPPGLNLLFSILLRPEATLAAWVRIPHLAGVAICRGIETALPELPEPIQLKWPNDLHLKGRKVGGILIESRSGSIPGTTPFAVLGVGINVNIPTENFPADLRLISTSLMDHAGRILSRNKIAASILAEWSAIYPRNLPDFAPVLDELTERSLLIDRKVSLQSGGREITGTVQGFGPDGELMILEAGSNDSTPIRSADFVRLVSPSDDPPSRVLGRR